MKDFRKIIQTELDDRGWSRYELMKRSGVSKTSIYEYLRGEREIESDALERICVTLELELESQKDP
jgi:transcriptional regulator with XRE-family HTH domain